MSAALYSQALGQPRAVLCADSASLTHPELIGLPDERLQNQPWLEAISDADVARKRMKSLDPHVPVWVAGSNQIDAINLAAALHQDGRQVSLVSFQKSGSLYSRAHAAGISEVLDQRDFVARYGSYKRQPDSATHDQISPLQVQVVHANSSYPSTLYPETVSVPEKRGFVVAVVSAAGGTGKSVVSMALGLLFQQAGFRSVLIDADVQSGDLHLLMGENDPLRSDVALSSPGRIAQLKPDADLPALIAAPERAEVGEQIAGSLPQLINEAARSFDVVVINTGSRWIEAQLDIVAQASRTIFVLDQSPWGMPRCKQLLELCARCGLASQHFIFAINRCSRHALFTSIDVSCALAGAHAIELQEGGKEISENLGSGQPLAFIDPKNPFIQSVCTLMEAIAPPELSSHVAESLQRNKRSFSLFRAKP